MKKYLYIILLFVSCNVCRYETVYGQVTVNNYANTNAALSFTNVTLIGNNFTAGKLYITVVTSTATGTPPVPTMTGTGQTWTQIATVTKSNMRTTAFRFYCNSANTNNNTVFIGAGQTGYCINRFEITGVPSTGINGADAIVQSATNNATGANPSITLSAISSANNAVISVFASAVNPFAGTPESGWTEDFDGGNTVPTGSYVMHRITTTDNTPTVTAAASDWGGIAIEIKPLATGRVMLINQP